MRRAVAALVAAVLLGATAACSATVDGTGHAAPAFPSTGAPAPSGPSAAVPPGTGPGGSGAVSTPPSCPTVHDTAAHLTYACLTTGLSFEPGADLLWPVAFVKTVEPSTGWVVEEGSADWGPPVGKSLAQIATAVRQRLVENGGYGDKPTVTTVASKAITVSGRQAHVLQTTMTINPAWAKQQGTKVKTEHLWIVALSRSASDVSLWYTSVPDLVSNLWPKVASVISSIKVS